MFAKELNREINPELALQLVQFVAPNAAIVVEEPSQ